jgi:hypothetical protein
VNLHQKFKISKIFSISLSKDCEILLGKKNTSLYTKKGYNISNINIQSLASNRIVCRCVEKKCYGQSNC